jgi:hypothetical protein
MNMPNIITTASSSGRATCIFLLDINNGSLQNDGGANILIIIESRFLSPYQAAINFFYSCRHN